ncbi:transcription termination factor NusA [Candidatus Dependentiae bacterium]|nr:MAG: transcription termination factor NusA [Candidatus Dependentiae bacterium]
MLYINNAILKVGIKTVNLSEVIDSLVQERSLDREKIIQIVCDGIRMAYDRRFPDYKFIVEYSGSGNLDVFAEKQAVESVTDDVEEISLRKARIIDTRVVLGDAVNVPFDGKIGRIEILAARQTIALCIRELEQRVVYDEFKDRKGSIVGGTVHKKERAGYSIIIGEHSGFLPQSNVIPEEQIRVGTPIRVLLKDVLPLSQGGYQLILDRVSPEFVKDLIHLEIPEVFEGIVEIKKIVRIPGYKTKVVVLSNNQEIDPVGTCVGVGGARIKPILKELGNEKVDLIPWTDDLELLVKLSLKPAEIDRVEVTNEQRATVWLAHDQRSFAIGKLGQNIALASRLTGIDVQLQAVVSPRDQVVLEDIVTERREPTGKEEEEVE